MFDLGSGSELIYWHRWLGAEHDALMQVMAAELPWQQPEIVVAGKNVAIPRLQCWFGEAHANMRYSGKTFKPLPWPAALANIRQRVMEACDREFNSVLVNFYRTGQDSVGWHADDEPEFGSCPSIASLSLGTRRSFQLKPKNRKAHDTGLHPAKDSKMCFDLGEGDLLLMAGTTQQHWQHAVPKTRKRIGARINMTFRLVYNAQ